MTGHELKEIVETVQSWRGKGLLVDRGYASLQRLRDCHRFGVAVVLRLKENWKPKGERIIRGDVSQTFLPEPISMSSSPMKCLLSATPSMQT
jgi:hypothetical protein